MKLFCRTCNVEMLDNNSSGEYQCPNCNRITKVVFSLSEKAKPLDEVEEEMEEFQGKVKEDLMYSDFNLDRNFEPNSVIVEHTDEYALIRHHDSDSPSCECPTVYEIRKKGGETVWRQDICYMSEYVYEGTTYVEASSDQRKCAYEKWEEVTK